MIKINIPFFHSSYFAFFSCIWECLCYFGVFCPSYWNQFLVSPRLQVKNYSQNSVKMKKCRSKNKKNNSQCQLILKVTKRFFEKILITLLMVVFFSFQQGQTRTHTLCPYNRCTMSEWTACVRADTGRKSHSAS